MSTISAGTALALLCPGTAIAQQAEPESAPVFLGRILLDPSLVRATDPDGNAADRANSQYVAEAELDRARMGDLKDLFAGIASVSVGGAIPVAQKIFVNGVDMLNLAVTVDGVSQNNRLFHHVSANAFDPGLMKFVRVDAGAAPADAGPHAMAGAVVMETVDARDVLEDGQNVGGNVRLSFGDNGNTFGRAATLAGRSGGFEWLGYAKRATGDDYETGSGDEVAGSAADLTTMLLKLAFESPDGHRFELSGQRMADDALRPFRANFISDGRPFAPRRYDTTRDTVAFSYENTLAEGFWDPKIVLGKSKVRIGVDQPTFPELGVSWGDSATTSGKIENRIKLGMGTVTVGVDFYDRESTYSDDTVVAITEASRNTGLFAQARLDPTEALSLSFGMRYDRQDFTGTTGWSDDFAGFSGNLSVSYALNDKLTLRGGTSSVFGGLTIEDNFIYNPAWDYDSLRPSRSTNYTLGFDYEAGSLDLSGELFLTKIDDARVSSFRSNTNGDAESRGFNLGLGYGWDDGYLRASYSQSKVKVNGAGADSFSALDLGAPLGGIFAIELQHTPEGSDFTFGGSIDAATRYSDIEGVADAEIPGYAVLNLFTEYASPSIEGLVVRAEVNNVFDKEYADRASYGADFADVTPFYEPGRTISIVAAMKF
ncbi:MAG: TonB-dependent receptor [Cypionkella sp.]|uniref:TonB-dependent receptor domain-containing protein n=1 Tax=Cypionkella sp. TaxID=2811411 RepID=UPI002AB9E529|nr:TonB-dependent receptor [Cypionkella sp.]MDZ4309486.1 TonB-dependent receptor [Cypionkella sp.]